MFVVLEYPDVAMVTIVDPEDGESQNSENIFSKIIFLPEIFIWNILSENFALHF